MTKRRALGAQLAWDAAWCMATGLLLFFAITLLSLYVDMQHDGAGADATGLAFVELIEQLAWASIVAAPLATTVAVLMARWAARRATARLDALIANAACVDLDNIGERLAESNDDDEIGRLTRALNALLARIDHGIAVQRQFAADASHELRTPLAAIISSLEVARRRHRNAQHWAQLADQTLNEARRMAGLVEALLHVARPAGADSAMPAVSLNAVFAALAERWAQRSPGLTLELDAGPDAMVNIDARALDIVFDNLIANAVAHGRSQGRVCIKARCVERLVRITIEDDGPGVPAAERSRVFEAFARGAGAADRDAAQPGVGLGLAIVRRIVEAGGGSIVIDAACATGARFVIEVGDASAHRPEACAEALSRSESRLPHGESPQCCAAAKFPIVKNRVSHSEIT